MIEQLSPKEIFLKELNELIAKRKYLSGEVLLSSIIVKGTDKRWRNCITKARFLSQFEKVKVRGDIVYDTFALLENKLKIADFLKLLGNAEHGFKLSDIEVIFNRNFRFCNWCHESSNTVYSEYPCNLFHAGGDKVPPINYPTAKSGIVCFRDGFDAIDYWLKLDLRKSELLSGKILIILPDYSCKINNIELKKEGVDVHVQSRNREKKLECQAVFNVRGEIIRINSHTLCGDSKILFRLKDEPIETYIQVITSNDERLDYYEETPLRHSGRTRLIQKEISKELLKRIHGGENERTEFKPYIYLSTKSKGIQKDETKKQEIVRTVIAFSNTKGGSIFFGVSDDCEINRFPLKNIDEQTRKSLIEDYKADVRRLLRNSIAKGVDIEFKEHPLSDNLILELVVKEGNNKPYYLGTKQPLIFIRAGSSNRVPHPETELSNFV